MFGHFCWPDSEILRLCVHCQGRLKISESGQQKSPKFAVSRQSSSLTRTVVSVVLTSDSTVMYKLQLILRILVLKITNTGHKVTLNGYILKRQKPQAAMHQKHGRIRAMKNDLWARYVFTGSVAGRLDVSLMICTRTREDWDQTKDNWARVWCGCNAQGL